MAVFQDVFNFFLPQRRRSTPIPPSPAEEAASERLLAGVGGVLAGFDISEQLSENIKEDVKLSFAVFKPRPGYEPEAVAPVVINLLDAATDPISTAWKSVKAISERQWEVLGLATGGLRVAADKAVWKYQFDNKWVDDSGNPHIPSSLQQAVLRWNEGANVEILRTGRDAANNPGFTFMLAHRMEVYYSSQPGATYVGLPQIGGTPLNVIRSQAQQAEQQIAVALAAEDWSLADKLQKDWVKASKSYRGAVKGRFERLSRKEGSLYDEPEAQFLRYWELRNQHYQTLNFLRVYKKDGAWGVVRNYGWFKLTAKVFKKGTWREWLYPPNVIKKIGSKTFAKVLEPLARQLTTARALVRKGIIRLAERVGLRSLLSSIGAAIGSIMPGAGTVAGAIIGGIVQFLGEVVLEKLGGVLKIVGVVLAGVLGCLTLTLIGFVVLLSIIFSGSPTPSDANCDQTATATDACVLSKSGVKRIADNWGVGSGNHVEECYHDVIAKAKAAGIDPAFATAIWLNESNASNYNVSVEDFGVHDSSVRGFTAQITHFLALPGTYKSQPPWKACFDNPPVNPNTGKSMTEMEAFLWIFRSGACDPNDAEGSAYSLNLPSVYDTVRLCPRWEYPNKK